MKIYYFNDTNSFQNIHINDLFKAGETLSPHRGDFFEVSLKDNQIPFIKIWEGNVVLISGMDFIPERV